MDELKACPFCGEIPQVTHEKSFTSLEFNKNYPNNGRNLYLERETYSVECVCCKQSKAYFTEEEAIAAWNRRTQPENKQYDPKFCTGCRSVDNDADDYPCNECRRAYTDKFEPEQEEVNEKQI